MSVLKPHVYVPCEALPDFNTYQTPLDGRNTATSTFPSPSKSPGTGVSPPSPHEYEIADVKLVVDRRMYHTPEDGR